MAPTKVTEKQMNDARLLLSWGVVQTMLGDKHESSNTAMVDALEENVYSNLKHCEEWSAIFLKDLMEMMLDTGQIKDLNDHMKDYLIQSFRQRHVSLSPSCTTKGRPFGKHITVIRKLNPELSRNLRLDGTLILDRLQEFDILSEGDRQSILAQPTDKRKNEAFINYLCSHFTTEDFKATVIPLLSKDEIHAELAAKIEQELDEANTSGSLTCTFCKMKALANPRKLAEALYEQSAISESLKHDLCLSTQPSSTKWEDLFKQVHKEEVLLKALKKTYPHLLWEFQETGHPVLKCSCHCVVANTSSSIPSDYLLDVASDVSTITLTEERIASSSIRTHAMPSKQVRQINKPQTHNSTSSNFDGAKEDIKTWQQDGVQTTNTWQQDGGQTTNTTADMKGVARTVQSTNSSNQKMATTSSQQSPSRTINVRSLQQNQDQVELTASYKGLTNTPASHGQTGTSVSHGQTGTPVSHGQTGIIVSHGQTGTPVSHGQTGTPVSHGQTGIIVSHGQTGTPASHGQTGTNVSREQQDIRDDRSELQRLEVEYKNVQTLLSTDSTPHKIQENQGNLTRLKRLIDQRKELLELSEERKKKSIEVRGRIEQFEQDYEQSNVLFQKVTASRMLEATKKELEKLEEDYAEKRRKLESACVVM